ncbi:hypothetical protein CASFOL_001935 [Castilleja foliolosa]|uniref:Uncharacterized protein n=1 Tax=Castilleja foliolosa TaxID=1961234 RepID=A0ABD3EGF0_9LAMI
MRIFCICKAPLNHYGGEIDIAILTIAKTGSTLEIAYYALKDSSGLVSSSQSV